MVRQPIDVGAPIAQRWQARRDQVGEFRLSFRE
jgi:hypothetical protein